MTTFRMAVVAMLFSLGSMQAQPVEIELPPLNKATPLPALEVLLDGVDVHICELEGDFVLFATKQISPGSHIGLGTIAGAQIVVEGESTVIIGGDAVIMISDGTGAYTRRGVVHEIACRNTTVYLEFLLESMVEAAH